MLFWIYAEIVGLTPCKKAFAELLSKSDNASPHPLAPFNVTARIS